MDKTGEYWDWGDNAPLKINCTDYYAEEYRVTPDEYYPFGCIMCREMRCDCRGDVTCNLGHSVAHLSIKRSKHFRPHRKRKDIKRDAYYIAVYRTHEQDERPLPITADTIMIKLDEIVAEAKPILPEKEKAYGNLFPGGHREIARRIVEKANRLAEGMNTDSESVDDTERDLLNYIAIHRACRERESED